MLALNIHSKSTFNLWFSKWEKLCLKKRKRKQKTKNCSNTMRTKNSGLLNRLLFDFLPIQCCSFGRMKTNAWIAESRLVTSPILNKYFPYHQSSQRRKKSVSILDFMLETNVNRTLKHHIKSTAKNKGIRLGRQKKVTKRS